MVLFGLRYGSEQSCSVTLVDHGRGYLGILVSCLICESAIMWLSMRGSILYTQPREAVQYVIYIRLGEPPLPLRGFAALTGAALLRLFSGPNTVSIDQVH